MNGATQALVSSAAAYVGEVGVDFRVGRIGEVLQERDRGHALSRVAVTALRHVFRDPGALHRVAVVRREAFAGRDLGAVERADRHRARAHRSAVEMHGARAALGDAAAEFGAGQADDVAQHPQEWRIRLDVDLVRSSVDLDGDHRGSPQRWVMQLGDGLTVTSRRNQTSSAIGPRPRCNALSPSQGGDRRH
jgi:hypothetical protein